MCIHTDTHTYIYYICVCVPERVYVYTRSQCLYMYVYVCMYACTYTACLFLYMQRISFLSLPAALTNSSLSRSVALSLLHPARHQSRRCLRILDRHQSQPRRHSPAEVSTKALQRTATWRCHSQTLPHVPEMRRKSAKTSMQQNRMQVPTQGSASAARVSVRETARKGQRKGKLHLQQESQTLCLETFNLEANPCFLCLPASPRLAQRVSGAHATV